MASSAGVRLPAIGGATGGTPHVTIAAAAMSSLKRASRAMSAAAGGGAAAAASAASAITAASVGAAASPFCVFADQPDQLLCSPDNSIWVYGQYTLSFFTSEAAAQTKLEKRVRAMMREAQRHYDVSCAYFHSLSSEEQMADVLRDGGGSGLSGPLALPAAATASVLAAMAAASRREAAAAAGHGTTASSPNGAGGGGGGGAASADDGTASNASGATTATAVAAERHERQRVLNVCRALREAWPGPRPGPEAADLHVPPNGADDDAAGTGTSPTGFAPGLRVNIVLDIVASRKTLGSAAVRSRPYRLAEHLYQRIMGPVLANTRASVTRAATSASVGGLAPHVRTLVIGISDVDTTLVGAHVVCPYRHVSAPSQALTRLRRAIEAAADQAKAQAVASTATPAAATAAAAGSANGNESIVDGRGSSVAASALTGGAGVGVAGSAAAAGSSSSLSEFVPSPLDNVVATQLARFRRVDALLPAPYVRVPPTSLTQIDQSRLILCAPGRQLAEV